MDIQRAPITVVTVCDNMYSVMLAVLLKSIDVNTTDLSSIFIYIVDDNISPANKVKLRDSVSSIITLIFVPLEQVIPDQSSLPLDSSSFPLNVYVRLFIPSFLPKECHKAIYLDVDMVVVTDLRLLWEVDTCEYIIGAVLDRSETVSSTWGGITNYKELGLREQAPYFNSGLLLIKLDLWRKTNITQEILKCISDNKAFANFPDQYGLNVIFADNWFQLPKQWNSFSSSVESKPYIIHFIGNKPIFKSYNSNEAYREVFLSYLSMTAYKDFKVLRDYKRLIKKIKNMLIKKIKNFTR